MANFDIAYKRVLDDEGVTWENHPDDAGGETYAGLTRKADPSWGGWKIIDQYKKKPNFPSNLSAVKSQLLELAKPFYRSKYWDKVWGDKIQDQRIANDMFNTYVLTGTASIKLQNRQFGFTEKTVMDDQLLNKLNSII
jgi:lysozyme family protein